MAKALLLNALHDALSDYVVGLSPERLKFGVWSGKIELNELEVNPEAVNQLRLPVKIIHGTINRLEVDIPWAKLGSRPVKVLLQGVSILAGPVDKGSWGDDEVRERRLGVKRAALEKAEKAARKAKEGRGSADDDTKGFVEKLVKRVVDNMEINVADIHIRYEDAMLLPGQTISAGVCLESFVVATTDKDFVPQFIDRTGGQSWHTRVHKLARITGFSVYWRVDDKERYELIPKEIRSDALRRLVAEQARAPSGKNGGGLDRGDLIRPTGALLKFIHCDHPDDKTGPKFEASFEMDDVKMDFRAEQYEQVLSLKDSFAALSNWQTFFPFRPKTTPLQDPKAWWRYAFVCVRGKPNDWATLNKVLMARKVYVSLFERVAAATSTTEKANVEKVSSDVRLSPLTIEEERRLDELEEELPLQTIVMFRTMARKELQRKRDAARAKLSPEEAAAAAAAQTRKKGAGWWGSFWSSAVSTKEDGDLALQDLTASFGQDAGPDNVPSDYLQARVTIRPQGSLRLYGRHDLPLVEATMIASATAELREDSSMAFSFRLSRMDVLDLLTAGAVFPYLLKAGGHDDGNKGGENENINSNAIGLVNARAKVADTVAAGSVGGIEIGDPYQGLIRQQGTRSEELSLPPLACLNASMTKTMLKVVVCALPTDVVYNREAVDAVVTVFSARPAETKEAIYNTTKSLKVAQERTQSELQTLSISVSLDIAAPRVVVPVSSCVDGGFVLFDMGHMLITGGSLEDGESGERGGNTMTYRAELSDVNVRLPAKKSLLRVRQSMDAVIEPFKIKADATFGGGISRPGVVVAVEVMPGVRGFISPDKIRGLFKVLDYVTKADLNALGAAGERPTGLAAPNTMLGGGGGAGIERMGGDDGLVAIELGDGAGDVRDGPAVLLELRMKLPSIGLLLVEADEEPINTNNGLLIEAAGMSMDVETSRQDMTVQLHLDTVTVQDKARPDDSPFRNMIYSKPDESSRGGLIHVTYWASSGGVRRVPPATIVEDNHAKYDIVVDARFSTLQMALDKESIIKATPFYKAVMRHDEVRQDWAVGASTTDWYGGVGDSNRQVNITGFVGSASSRIVSEATKRLAPKDSARIAILAKASMTSVLLELVRSDPWETVMRAGISGLKTSFSSDERAGGGTTAWLTLEDILVTDVRPEAKDHPFTVILAPLASASQGEGGAGGASGSRSRKGQQISGGSSLGEADVDKEAVDVETPPLITVKARTDGGADGGVDAEVNLASFACNFMVDPISEFLVVLNEVNIALQKMIGRTVGSGDGSCPVGMGHRTVQGDPQDFSRSSPAFAAIDEEEGTGSENPPAMEHYRAWEHEKEVRLAAFNEVSGYSGDRGKMPRAPWRNEGSKAPTLSPSPIRARLSLDDWRINLIEDPSEAGSKMVVLRASWLAVFTRSAISGEGGNKSEDALHLSLLKTEYLVDTPPFGGGGGGEGGEGATRRVSQVLEPFSAEVFATLVSAEGSLLSVQLRAKFEAVRARLSYTDMMLVKCIADRATAAYHKLSSAFASTASGAQDSEADRQIGGGGGDFGRIRILPETYGEASRPIGGRRRDKARAAVVMAATRVGLQPSRMATISFLATCSTATIVLVNDYEGRGVPVLSFTSRAFKGEGSGVKEDFSLRVSGSTEVGFFNVKVVRWEPLCEPWQPVLTMAVGLDAKGRRTIQIKLTCKEIVVVDLTSDFMESFLSTYWMLFSDGGAKDDPFAFVDGAGEAEKEMSPSNNTASTPKTASSPPAPPVQKHLEWTEESVPLQGLKEGTVTLKNRTGLQLVVGTTDFPEKKLMLGAHDAVRLPFHSQRDHAQAGEFDLHGKAVLVGWGDGDVKRRRESLPPLQVDRKGVRVFPLLPTTPTPSDHVASAPVVVEAYQSQRYNMVTGEWSAPYMRHDGPEFTTKDWRQANPSDDRERPLDSITLPDDKQWAWRDAWHVDFSKEVGTQIDEEGWEYRVELASFNLIASSRTRRDLDQARRRKWIRTRAPKPLPLNDAFRPLYIAWQIDVTPQGRLEATIRSTIQLTNSTGLPLEVRALCSAWPPTEDGSEGPGRRSLGYVAPGCTLDVPVEMVYASHLQLRPTLSSSFSPKAFASIAVGGRVGAGATDSTESRVFEWSAPLPLLVNNVDTSRDDWVSCREMVRDRSGGQESPVMATVSLAVHAETTVEGCVIMAVLPPVTVVNALPCPLSFRAFLPAVSAAAAGRGGSIRATSVTGAAAAKPSPARLLEVATAPTAETSHLHTLEVGDGAKFSIKIANHGWSAAMRPLPLTREELRKGRWANQTMLFQLPCLRDDGGEGGRGGGGHLEVRCLMEPRAGKSCPAVRVHLFCTHWLVDRSGLKLGFGVGGRRRLPVPVVNRKEAQAPGMEEREVTTQSPVQVHVSPVEQLSCAIAAGGVVSTAAVGGLLYTDREYVFKEDSLPVSFRGATMIRTACSDKNNGAQHFLRFRVMEACTVHVLFDRRCAFPPSWLTAGFRLTAKRVHVVHETNKGSTIECPFAVWSRDSAAWSWINLGGNKASEADAMYIVLVTEQEVAVPFKAIGASEASPSSSSTIKRKISSREDLMESWALGNEGLALCNSPEERVRVAVPEGAGRGIDRGGRDYGDDGLDGYTRDAWSDELDVPVGANGVFQIKGTKGEVYELALRAEACPGTFHRTTQVTVIPRYCLVNLLRDENIWLKEPGAPESSAVCLPPGGRLPWHWMFWRNKHSGVRVRTESTAWSYGDVVINRVGTTALHIPSLGANEDRSGEHSGGQTGGRTGTGGGGGGGATQNDTPGGEQTVVHVDVQLADETFVDEHSLLVVFWKADERFAPIYLARNASPVTVHLHQADADREDRQVLSAKDVWELQPGESRQIGWAFPAAQRSLLIYAGTGSRAVRLSTDAVGNYAKIPTGANRGGVAAAESSGGGAVSPSYVWASVVVKGATKVIHISPRPPLGSAGGGGSRGGGSGQQQQQQQQQHQQQQVQQQVQQQIQQNLEMEAANERKRESEAPALELECDMRGFGLSVIGFVCGRRQELIYAQVSDVWAKLSRDRLSSLQASIASLQVDNHLPDGVFPVLVSKRQQDVPAVSRSDRGTGGGGSVGRTQEDTPFLQLSIIKEVNQSTNTAHYDYVAFRMLEVDVMADRATLLHLLVWCQPIQGYLLMWKKQLDSRAWVARRTAEVLKRGAQDVPGGSVDVEKVRSTARFQRKYFKTLQFHPIILRFSYVNSPASETLVKTAGMPSINKIPSMMKSNVNLASYLVEDTFGSVRSMYKNILAHYYLSGSTQVLSLVGSMRALGSPADLISNVGSGVKALVYAPAQGLVQGPAEFFEGVTRGTQSFVKGTVQGVFNSVAGVGGAVTDTVSKLSFDNDYQLKRERDKNKAMAQQGGVGQGFLQGGKDIAGGFTSGVSGIFTAPVSGAKKGGVGGFFKGVGKGLVGAVVKPVVGVTDSVISVAQGISNEAENTQRQFHLRPRRALTKDSETGDLVLIAFSMEAAEAQALVESGGEGEANGSADKYESHTQISDLTIIFADTRMILVKRTKNDRLGSAKMLQKSGAAKPLQMISKAWDEVASVATVGESIVIGRYKGGNISLKAASASRREEVYRQFYVHRDKMGDPTSMRSPEEVFGSGASAPPPLEMTMRAHSMSMQESLRAYSFGSACGRQLQSHGLSDVQILDRAERRLQSLDPENWSGLDYIEWELVENWNAAHTGMSSCRCLCVVFINASTSPVQFLEMRKRDGQGYRLILGPLCDNDSQQILPGGAAILVAWGHPSTNILKKGFVVIVVETTAFSGVFAVQREKVAIEAKSGFRTGFLEKNMQEWWSKQVVVIK